MAVTLHPRLSQKAEETVQEEQENVPVAESAPEAPVELAPEPTSEVSAIAESNTPEALEVSPAEPAPDPRKWIDPSRGYYQELARLEREDLEFKNALRTRAGRMAASEWRPKVANLEAEAAELRKQLQQERLKSLEPEDIKERLYQDPQFRKEFDQPNIVDPALLRQRAAFVARVASAEDAAEQYLPPEEIAKHVGALRRGAYDAVRDQAGNVVRTLAPEESLAWFERDLATAAAVASVKQEYARAAQPPPAPAPAATPPPQPVAQAPAPAPQAPAPAKSNPALAQAAPVILSPQSPRGGKSMLYSEYKKLNPAQRMAMYRTVADVERAFETGDLIRDE